MCDSTVSSFINSWTRSFHLNVGPFHFAFCLCSFKNSLRILLRFSVYFISQLPLQDSTLYQTHSFPTFVQLLLNRYVRAVLVAHLGKTSPQRSPIPSQRVYLFVKVNGHGVMADTADLSDERTPGNRLFSRRLHSHDHPFNEELNHVVIRSPALYHQFETFFYPYQLVTANNVLETPRELYTSGFHA